MGGQHPVSTARDGAAAFSRTVAYRPPRVALVHPAVGGSVPQDAPVVVFRLLQGESDDPLDLATFRVAVDGRDRTSLFIVTAAKAWGSLGAGAAGTSPLAAGVHLVVARVCSARGACATVSHGVVVAPSPFVATRRAGATRALTARILAAIGAALTALKPRGDTCDR